MNAPPTRGQDRRQTRKRWLAIAVSFILLPLAPAGWSAAVGPASAPHHEGGSVPPVGKHLSPTTIDRPVPRHTPAASHALTVGARWFNLTPGLNPSPGVRYGGQMAYDVKDGYTVYFSGTNISAYPFDDTWTYKGGTWAEIFPTLSPSARIGSVMVYDAVDQCVVLSGGEQVSTSAFLADTWEFSGGVWTNVTAGPAPPARATASGAWDPDTQSVILFGGQNSTTVLGDTWRFVGGTWTELFPASSPSARVAPALAFDTTDDYLMLFGGATYTGNLADTFKFVNGTWSELFPAAAPSGRAVWGSQFDPVLGAVVLFGGGVGNDTIYFGDTWTFRGGVWTEQFPVTSPGARQFAPMVWDGADNYIFIYGGQVIVGANDSVIGESWAYVAPLSLAISAPTRAIDVGQPVVVSAVVSGGVLPYTLAWSLGDGANATGASVTHTYTSAGTDSATVTLTDAFDETALANHSLTIAARPSVTVVASPASATIGENVTLTATPTGGSAPLTFAWTLGDGRTSATPGPLVVSYAASGNYTINVTVTDAAGVSASKAATLSVQKPLPTPVVTTKASGSSLPWLWIAVAIVVVAALLTVALVLRGRRKRGPPPGAIGAPAPGPWTPPPSPPSTP
ncbi:MAG: PKD domain-containing protein [Thermoplasmata archaeon]|nr:PKD domain-containing protein [Thermoplasmata archaeon]